MPGMRPLSPTGVEKASPDPGAVAPTITKAPFSRLAGVSPRRTLTKEAVRNRPGGPPNETRISPRLRSGELAGLGVKGGRAVESPAACGAEAGGQGGDMRPALFAVEGEVEAPDHAVVVGLDQRMAEDHALGLTGPTGHSGS